MVYKYKGTDITNIIHPGSNTQPDFTGFPAASGKNSAPNSRIPDLGYSLNSVDIGKDLNARHYKYTTNYTDVPIPANAKHVRYILQGGGGGGGGGGGAANSGMPAAGVAGKAYGAGGDGGQGSVGQRTKTTSDVSIPSLSTKFKVIIGAAGTGGNGGNTVNTLSNDRVGGNYGEAGVDGGDTSLYFDTTRTARAWGGNSGNRGGRGIAEWYNSNDYEYKGEAGNMSTRPVYSRPLTHTNAAASDWNTAWATASKGGAAGLHGNFAQHGKLGEDGDKGYAVIVWLYK